MNRLREMWRESPDKLNPRFNTHLATGLVAIGFTGIVLGELSPPVLKINNHATGGWRTKDILGRPKILETKKLGSSKG